MANGMDAPSTSVSALSVNPVTCPSPATGVEMASPTWARLPPAQAHGGSIPMEMVSWIVPWTPAEIPPAKPVTFQ